MSPAASSFAGAWTNRGIPGGVGNVGVNRIKLEEGEISTPAHVHGADEEIFFVLAGDCLVHEAQGKAHTLCAGAGGLDVLAFGERAPVAGAHLPQVGIRWLRPPWPEAGGGRHPFDREQNTAAP